MLYRGARILIMDEPTAVLAPQEIERPVPDAAVDDGSGAQSIVFISHKLGEVLSIADRVTVMRRGKVTAAGVCPRPARRRPSSPADGRPRGPRERSSARRCRPGDVVLALRATSRRTATRACPPCAASRSRSAPARSSASRASPATARASWPRCITGLRPCRGSILVGGEDIANRPVARGDPARRRPTCPEDRTGVGTRARTSRSSTT